MVERNDIRLFFFSSRRRHTRCSRDWSSDVCSSDLSAGRGGARPGVGEGGGGAASVGAADLCGADDLDRGGAGSGGGRGLGLVPQARHCRSGCIEIGRASCRERVWIWVVAGEFKRKT